MSAESLIVAQTSDFEVGQSMELAAIHFLPLLFFSVWTFSHLVSSLSSDGLTLLALSRHWTTVPSPLSSSWNASDSTPCNWLGVECNSGHSTVVSLNLSDLRVSGRLGSEIGCLTRLQTLDLSLNNFSGPIPARLGNCSGLEYLDLSSNGFTGEIPGDLKHLRNLSMLSLYNNSLSGEIPHSLFEIPGLEHVYLHLNVLSGSLPSNIGNVTEVLALWVWSNQLSGPVPDSIGNCSNLEELYLNDNSFTGVLPESLNYLENLVYLDVSSNHFKGNVPFSSGPCGNLDTLVLSYNRFPRGLPPELGNCSNLTTLAAVSANLTGHIPSTFGLLSKLSNLYLSENQLSGRIPPELGKCESLISLQIYSNQLEGEIPMELGSLSSLKDLSLFSNRLVGEIPISIWRISTLENVLLYNNNLFGELPAEVAELQQLKIMTLFNNHFSGVIPHNLGINSSLTELDLTNNSFTGAIPPYLCRGKQLQVMVLGLNRLRGSVPLDIGSCPSLSRLIIKENNLTGSLPEFDGAQNLSFIDVSRNSISGAIPRSFGKCNNLSTINLSSNNLSGSIPSELGNLYKVKSLNLSHNVLGGPLPVELSNCKLMENFDVGFNSLNGSISSSFKSWTSLSTLILSGNHFSGGIAPLSELEKLSVLQVGGNMFKGEIPDSIGSLKSLTYDLDLSNNGLSGQLPSGFGNLIMLQRLDVSANNLSGDLSILGGLQALIEINVSSNLFTGPVPEALWSKLNSSPSSFSGNPPGLCVNCLPRDSFNCPGNSVLRPCDSLSNRKGLQRVNVIVISLCSSLFIIAVLIGVVCLIKLCRRPDEDVEISVQDGPSSLLNKVMGATENLNERYLIGKGAHGTVFKASLGPDKIYAVKKLVFGGHRGGRLSMVREIQTVKALRHRNLVKLEEFWIRKDYGLLLYPYMENGSLHGILHTRNSPAGLEWSVRYKIALGVAHGLAYLHHDCDPAVVHRDIKPENILLDSEMEPHISDFGIAKLLDLSSTATPSASIVGTIGYIAPGRVVLQRDLALGRLYGPSDSINSIAYFPLRTFNSRLSSHSLYQKMHSCLQRPGSPMSTATGCCCSS